MYVENGIGYGGAVICLRHLLRNLDRSRFVPVVVTGKTGEGYSEIGGEAEWYCVPNRRLDTAGLRARISRMPMFRRRGLGTRAVDQVVARLDDAVNVLPAYCQMLKLMRRVRPDLVHLNNEPLCNEAALLAAVTLGIPVVSHIRDDLKGSWIMRRLFALPRHFIAVSKWVAETVAELGIPRRAITTVYDGLELEALDMAVDGRQFRRRYGIPDDAFAVGLVGLLIPWKGQRLFLDAIRLVVQRDSRSVCIDHRRNPCRVLAVRGGASGRCLGGVVLEPNHFHGARQSAVPRVQRIGYCRFGIAGPEPLGTVVIEALALGRVVIAPRHGGALEMIEDNRTGILFEPGSATDLARAIRQAHAHGDTAAQMGKAGRHSAFQKFEVAEHVRQVQRVYEEVLAG